MGSTTVMETHLMAFAFLVARIMPAVAMLRPWAADWTIRFDKVFCGRNYGCVR